MVQKTVNGKEKLKLMIEELSKAQGKPLTTGDLMKLLDCNRNSVNNYYKRCIASGINVIKTLVGHETGYYLDINDTVYEPLTVDMVRKYRIMQNMNPGADNKQELLGVNIRSGKGDDYVLESLGNIGISKYYQLVAELEQEGELQKIGDKYYPGRKKIPVAWVVDEWRAVEYLNILSMMPPGHHSQKMIESIYEKIRGIDETNDKDDSSYVLLGRVYSVLNRIRELLAVLGTVDYINKLIHISYKGKGEELIECVIATGAIVYSVEKDKLYLIGERRGSGSDRTSGKGKKGLTVFLDVEKITEAREEKGRNRIYRSRSVMMLYHRMFSAENSLLNERNEMNEKICIEFEDDPFIRGRLENLCIYRKESGAKLERTESKLIYSDNIVGLDDFFRFLRQFTGKYEVLNSKRLEKKRVDSLHSMLKAYREG